MVNFTILAGGFTSFIATYVFDSDAGSLSLVKQTTTGQNPSWIAPHSVNTSVLYAVNEIGPVGNLQSFIIDEEGGLTLVDTVETGGNGPTFTNPLTTGEVSAMNFGSPNASFIATDPEDPARFLRDSPAVNFPVNGGPSNPHMSLEFNGEVFVPDLGADKVWRLVNDGEPGNFRVQGQIDVTPGNGPRHIAIRDGLIFILHEKTSVLTVQAIPTAPNGTTPVLANVSIVPPEAANFNGSFFAAEIVISEPSEKFPQPIIYVSNRNLGPEFDEQGDSIAIFEFTALTSDGNSTDAPAPDSEPTAVPSSTVDAPAAGSVFTTLVAAPGSASKRMVKYHARRRPAHEQARRQYGGYEYGSGDSEATPSSPAAVTTDASAPAGSVITLVSAPTPAAETASPSVTEVAEPGEPTSTSAPPTAGTLRLTNQVFTGLRQIRSFAIGKVQDGGDEFLIAGANLDGGVAVFKRIDEGRNLELVARNTELQNRTSFVFT